MLGLTTGSEFESWRLLDVEGLGILRDFSTIHQLGFVAKRNFPGGHNDLLEAPASKCSRRGCSGRHRYISFSELSLTCFDMCSIRRVQRRYFRFVVAPSFRCRRLASYF